MNTHSLPMYFAAVLLALAGTDLPAQAVELTVQNDSVTGTGDAAPCLCFIPGEIPASWLSVPADGTLVGVAVFWQSTFGGNPDSLEMAVHIYNGGTFPTPGSLLATVTGPTLSDGTFNDFRFTDPPTNSSPINISVTQGQTIVVGLEMLNQSSGDDFASSVSYDADGCQANKNGVFVDPSGWADACSQGVPGDWAIRAIVVPDQDIPATSQWGLVILSLLLVVAGTVLVLFRRALSGHNQMPG